MIESGEMPQDGEMPDGGKEDRQAVDRGGGAGVRRRRGQTPLRQHQGDADRDPRPPARGGGRRSALPALLHHDEPAQQPRHHRRAVRPAPRGAVQGAQQPALEEAHRAPPAGGQDGTVFAIDLRDLDWDKKGDEKYDRWSILWQRYPYGLGYEDSDDDALEKIDKEIDTLGRRTLVYMRADWFVAHATRPPLYEHVLRLPKTAYELETKLGVDVLGNFRAQPPGPGRVRQERRQSGQNRLVERHDAAVRRLLEELRLQDRTGEAATSCTSRSGRWTSRNGVGKHLSRRRLQARRRRDDLPPAQRPAGLLPDRRQGRTHRRGPDRRRQRPAEDLGDAEIVNGLSCMACHKNGMIDSVLDEVRMGNSVAGEAKQKVRRLYPPRTIMLKYVEEDSELFLASLKKASDRSWPARTRTRTASVDRWRSRSASWCRNTTTPT